uniref:ATP synthase subunit 8 n=1 Tax=Macrocheles nataliae TaxID=2058476 RepID=A0A6B9WEH4_9ACAR|nr:ATP synthase subunit 8 [Macrocheles nataliae]
MPQMLPMEWTFLFFMCSMIIVMTISHIFFYPSLKNKKNLIKSETFKFNFSWWW